MAIVTRQQFKSLIRRQSKIEQEVKALRHIVQEEADEGRIRPAVLKRWDRISRELDNGKGHGFNSPQEMRQWLKNL